MCKLFQRSIHSKYMSRYFQDIPIYIIENDRMDFMNSLEMHADMSTLPNFYFYQYHI